jgi:hypothetical protein
VAVVSIVSCSVCGAFIDSDDFPHVFRTNDVVRCDGCEDDHYAKSEPPPGWEPPAWTKNEEAEEP